MTISGDNMSVAEFTAKELAALKKEHAPGATDEQFELWLADCKQRGLVPVRDVLLQLRTGEEWDPSIGARVKRTKAVYITTIGGIRKLAEGTGKYAGQLPSKWIYLDAEGRPTIESEVPLPDPKNEPYPLLPWAAKATILRKDFDAPLSVVARFWAYAQRQRDGSLTAIWGQKGRAAEMLEKCAESLAFRKGFPEQLSGLYIAEELMNNEEETSPGIPPPVVEPPAVAEVPTVNHAPAVPTDAPRPGEVRGSSSQLASAEEIPGVKSRSGPVETKPASQTTLVEILVPEHPPARLGVEYPDGHWRLGQETPPAPPTYANSVQRRARVKKATETFMENAGKPLPKHEQPVDPSVPIGATDDDLPAEMFKDDPPIAAQSPQQSPQPVQKMDEPPTKDEAKAITEKVRSYYTHGCKPDDLKNFALKIAGKEKPSEIGKSAWRNIFGQLDAALEVGGKAILLELIKPKPATTDNF
jgi:hypothetical protein